MPGAADPDLAGLDGVWNLRDLGGLPVRGGSRVRRGMVLRSATLWYASRSDCAVLSGLGISTVLDLRDADETQHQPNWVDGAIGAEHHSVPFSVPVEEFHGEYGGMADPAVGERYLRLLDHNTATVAAALRVLADADHRPVLFHCAAGKDRTGLLAAMVLGCLDVEPEAIVADYLATDAVINRIIDRFRGDTLYGPASARVPSDYRVNGLAMARFLELMDGTGGIRHWVLQHALDEAALAAMQLALVEAVADAPEIPA